jgi:hypothetical protein
MSTIKSFIASFFLAFFALFVDAGAQTPAVSTVNITPDSDKVRVHALGDVSGMRLEVSDEAGDIIFESGQPTGRALDWGMRDSQGERVAPGTYTVTVTYRMPSGKLRKRVEQVTVTEEVTTGEGRDQADAQAASSPTPAAAVATITGEGTANRMAKFTGPNAIDDSVMTESAGKIGLNTVAPTHALTVNGGPAWTTGNWLGSVALPNLGAVGWNANSAGQRQGLGHNNGGLHFFRTASALGASASPAVYDLTINNSGNVGVGTTVPSSKLTVNGDLQILGSGRGIKFADGSIQTKAATDSSSSWTGTGTPGSLVKFTGANSFSNSVVKEYGGNVGIGTNSPAAKLSVQSSGDPALQINHIGTSGNPALWLQQDGTTRAYLWWDRTGNRLNLGTPTTNPIISFQNNGAIKIPPTTRYKSIHGAAFMYYEHKQGDYNRVEPGIAYDEAGVFGAYLDDYNDNPFWTASVELSDGAVITEFCLSVVDWPSTPTLISGNLGRTSLTSGAYRLIARTFTTEDSYNYNVQNVCVGDIPLSDGLVDNNKYVYSIKVSMHAGRIVGARIKYQVTQLP